ncbi:MAG: four helix bundle protein [Clostridia bacterium]|nr:four helix bundle protein [Clostridia bacterium]
MINENKVKDKSYGFAIRIVNLYKYLTETKKEYVMSKQLLRAGTSIGANIAESEFAASRKDFLNKLYIALKESNETLYWLHLLLDTNFLEIKEYESLQKDAKEITLLLVSITKTLKKDISSYE